MLQAYYASNTFISICTSVLRTCYDPLSAVTETILLKDLVLVQAYINLDPQCNDAISYLERSTFVLTFFRATHLKRSVSCSNMDLLSKQRSTHVAFQSLLARRLVSFDL